MVGVLAGAEVEDVGVLAEVGGDKLGHLEFRAEADGLLLHVLDEVGALHAFGPAGKFSTRVVMKSVRRARGPRGQEGLEVGARGVDGGGEAGAAGAEDDGVAG